jgi:hypothetical protein
MFFLYRKIDQSARLIACLMRQYPRYLRQQNCVTICTSHLLHTCANMSQCLNVTLPNSHKVKFFPRKCLLFGSIHADITAVPRAISPVVEFPVSDWLKSAREFPVFLLVDIGQPTGWLEDLGGRCPMCRGSLTQDLVGPLVSDTRQEGENVASAHVAHFCNYRTVAIIEMPWVSV